MQAKSKKALIIIDLQNDYFPGGKLPLWNTDAVLDRVEQAILRARKIDVPVVLVQHIGDKDPAKAPFFNAGTDGAKIHPRIAAAAGSAPIVTKTFADAFHETNLDAILRGLGTESLLLCGMMTHNCVTHTAVSKAAEKYKVTILPDCATTINELMHMIALHGVSTRAQLLPSDIAL